MYFASETSPEAPIEAGAEAAVPADEAPLAAAPEALRGALEKRGFEQLTAVQQSVAQADDGARDLRISSQTGSGKTVAIGFALAAKLVDPARVGPTTLIIAPTRELTQQIAAVCNKLKRAAPVRCVAVYGGASQSEQEDELAQPTSMATLVVGTPGRLLAVMGTRALGLERARLLVLDEADRMLDMGFEPQIRKVRCPRSKESSA